MAKRRWRCPKCNSTHYWIFGNPRNIHPIECQKCGFRWKSNEYNYLNKGKTKWMVLKKELEKIIEGNLQDQTGIDLIAQAILDAGFTKK